jgi:hypothetical protein
LKERKWGKESPKRLKCKFVNKFSGSLFGKLVASLGKLAPHGNWPPRSENRPMGNWLPPLENRLSMWSWLPPLENWLHTENWLPPLENGLPTENWLPPLENWLPAGNWPPPLENWLPLGKLAASPAKKSGSTNVCIRKGQLLSAVH